MLEYYILCLVGILWGVTNYLIELNYYDYSSDNENYNFMMKLFLFLKINIKPIVFFILNQLASILFYICLGKVSLSLTVVLSNSVSFVTAMICENIHKRRKFSKEYLLGVGCVVLGIVICVNNMEA